MQSGASENNLLRALESGISETYVVSASHRMAIQLASEVGTFKRQSQPKGCKAKIYLSFERSTIKDRGPITFEAVKAGSFVELGTATLKVTSQGGSSNVHAF